jgi:hypothetical protein
MEVRLFSPARFFLLEQQGGIPPSHGLHGPGTGQGRDHVDQQQVVQVQPTGHQGCGKTAQDLTDDPAGGDQRKEPFGLPGVEQVVGQVPEQKRQKHLVLGFEHEQGRVNQIDAKGNDRPDARHGQPAEDEKPRQQPGAGQTGHEPGHDAHDEKGHHRVEHVHDRHVFDAVALQKSRFSIVVQENPGAADQEEQRNRPHEQAEFIFMDIEPAAYFFMDCQGESSLSGCNGLYIRCVEPTGMLRVRSLLLATSVYWG